MKAKPEPITDKRAVLISPEVYRLLQVYAQAERIKLDTAASELLRSCLDQNS